MAARNVTDRLINGPQSEDVTSTTTTEPPSYLAGPLSHAAQGALSRYNEGGDGQHTPLENMTHSGDRLVGESQNLISNTLQGNFLSPDSNPYLQQTFNRAADLTRGRLDSEFAGSGRNLGASLPARSEELQTLASNIYGQNFQAERDRQTNALASAYDFDPMTMFINRLAAITPGAGGTTTSTQPVFRTGLI